MAKLNLSNIGPMSNLVINGDFNIWQRGTSFAAIANGTYTADRFSYHKVGDMVHTVSRNTDVPTQAQSGHKSSYSLKVDCTTIDAAIAAGDYCFISHKIEGYGMQAVMGKWATISFWVKATKTGTYCFAMRNSAGDKTWISEYTVSSSDTWEKKTITVNFSDSTGTWLYTNGVGLICSWALATGSTFQSTADSWLATNDWATSNQVNATDSTDNNFFLSQVKFEIGNIATPFVPRHFGEELALCQRYFESSYNQGVPPGTATADAQRLKWASYVSIYIRSKFSSEKRAVGTGYVYSPVSGTVGTFYDWSATADDNTDVTVAVSTSGIECKNSSVTDNHLYGVHWAVDAEL